jgi:hypothetical protein
MVATLIDKDSSLAAPNTLDLFSTLPTVVGEKCTRLREVNLQSSLLQNGPFEFLVQSAHMLDLSRTYFTFKFRIYYNDAPYPEVDPKTSKKNPLIAPINNIGENFISQAVLTVNGQLVEDSGQLYYWRAFCESELTMDTETKKCNLGALTLYTPDDTHKNELFSSVAADTTDKATVGAMKNPGYHARAMATIGGKSYQCYSRLHLGLCNQNKLIPPNTPLKFTIYRNSNEFCVLNHNEETRGLPYTNPDSRYAIHLEHVALLVREVEIEQSLAVDIERLLASGRKIRYNIKEVTCRNFLISANRKDCPSNILSQGKPLPRRIIVALTNPTAYHGNYRYDPLRFENADLEDIFVDAGSNSWPMQGWSLDYENDNYGMAYLQFLEGLGFAGSSKNCGITYADFKESRAIYVVDLAANANLDAFNLQEVGQLSIRMRFRKMVPEPGLMVLVYMEGNQILNLDAGRNITLSNTAEASS